MFFKISRTRCSQKTFQWLILYWSPFLHCLWNNLEKLSLKNYTLALVFWISPAIIVVFKYVTYILSWVDWLSWGRSLLDFLKALKQPVRNVERISKKVLKWTRYLILIFAESFDPYEYVLATSLESMSMKTNSITCILDQVYTVIMESAIFRCTTKTLRLKSLNFLRWFLLISTLEQRYEHSNGKVRESEWKRCYWDINH